MRVLFSSTRGAGHLQPLLPYAQALKAGGHEVKIAGPVKAISRPLNAAGLAHALFDHPGDATLAPIWARFRGASPDESLALAIRVCLSGGRGAGGGAPRPRGGAHGLVRRDHPPAGGGSTR